MSDAVAARHGRLILVPALITLAVTLLRLAGELLHWSPTLFNPEAGGGGALVGIVWLVPVFGVYFALKIAGAGEGPPRLGRALAYVLLALVLLPTSGALAGALGVSQTSTTMLLVFAGSAIVAMVVALRGWPALGRVLVVYGLAARVPVAIVMLIAIYGNWGTHYDVPPSADFPAMAPLAKWFWIGLVPQLTVWIAFTVVVGSLFGILAVALVHRGHRPAAA
jgi:hypothetical protein